MNTAYAASDHDPGEALARGFADRVVRWARERKAPDATLEALRTAARMTSLATTAGHVCIHLDDIAAAAPGLAGLLLRSDLLASTMVGTPDAPGALPLILDDQGRLYLHRYFDYERRLARLALLTSHPPRTIDENTKQLLDGLFPGNTTHNAATPNWQKLAGALALTGRLTIISGGPGTGKTTTVVNLLACLLKQEPECRLSVRRRPRQGCCAHVRGRDSRASSAHLQRKLHARFPDRTVHGASPARRSWDRQ